MVQAASEKASLDERAQASVGQLVTWVLLPLLGVSVLFAYERNGRTLQRLLTTPTPKTTYLLSTIVGQLAIAMVQMLLLILFGVYVMHVPWGESPAGLAVMMVSFGLASVAMGTALGTYIKTERQANSLSIMLAQVLALLGGCWWPLEFFPPLMKTFAMALPTYWAMRGFSDLALRGLGMPAVLPEAGILLLYALVFFVIGVRRFRYE
jgi:ABC-2 type transport system permease protein